MQIVEKTEKMFDNFKKLEEYIFNEGFKGYDPYDGLMSPLFNLPFFKTNKTVRFIFQQLIKRIPFNIRPLFKIEKGTNPVTLGLCLQALSYSKASNLSLKTMDFIINELENMVSKGYEGKCWGYDFHWEARYSCSPPFLPTVVATSIITNGLFECYKNTKNEKALNICKSSVKFVMKNLNKMYEGDTFCYSYSPLDNQIVFNATMKGARLLSQIYSVTRDSSLLKEAKSTVKFVANHQNKDGSWPYSFNDSRDWVDNFHTGYILDCLDEYIKNTGDNSFDINLKNGVNYYVNNFFKNDMIPKYYNNKIYPVDSTAAAQSIMTLSRFGYYDIARNVVDWILENMQDENGYFYYQVHKHWTNKLSYMRWSNAWMFVALSYFLSIGKR